MSPSKSNTKASKGKSVAQTRRAEARESADIPQTPARQFKTTVQSRAQKGKSNSRCKGVTGPSANEQIRLDTWNFTHRLPNKAEKSKNGRAKGRALIDWRRPRMMEKLLLNILFECDIRSVPIPWDHIAHRLYPGATGDRLLQRFNRLRKELIAEGHLVPPMVGKRGNNEDPTCRGHVRAFPEDEKRLLMVRKVMFSEPMLDNQYNDTTATLLAHNDKERPQEELIADSDVPAALKEAAVAKEARDLARTEYEDDEMDEDVYFDEEESSGDDGEPGPTRLLRTRKPTSYKTRIVLEGDDDGEDNEQRDEEMKYEPESGSNAEDEIYCQPEGEGGGEDADADDEDVAFETPSTIVISPFKTGSQREKSSKSRHGLSGARGHHLFESTGSPVSRCNKLDMRQKLLSPSKGPLTLDPAISPFPSPESPFHGHSGMNGSMSFGQPSNLGLYQQSLQPAPTLNPGAEPNKMSDERVIRLINMALDQREQQQKAASGSPSITSTMVESQSNSQHDSNNIGASMDNQDNTSTSGHSDHMSLDPRLSAMSPVTATPKHIPHSSAPPAWNPDEYAEQSYAPSFFDDATYYRDM